MQHDHTMSQWVRWIADQVTEVRADVGEIRSRLATLEGRSKWAWLASVPWRALGMLIGGTVLMISGHMTVPELKAWLATLRP